MNRIKITFGSNDRIAIIIPADDAGPFAALMARGGVYERDGYMDTSPWKAAEKGVSIEFVSDSDFAAADPKLIEANKRYEEANSARWMEYNKLREMEKERDQLKAQLAAVKSVGVCRAGSNEDIPV